MKLLLLSLIAVFPSLAQFRSIEAVFEDIGCISCLDSISGRLQRVRGVESAVVDREHKTLKIGLAAENRVRLEQVRDLIEQDGTKLVKAAVRVKGELSQQDGKWVLRPAGLSTSYAVESKTAALAPGIFLLTGNVAKLRPGSGAIVIEAAESEKSK